MIVIGVSNDGFGGLFTGFGKGLVGTVTKPAVGVLDLATGAASAVRDSSRSSSKEIPKRIRPPRLVIGPGGILPRYSEKQGRGQELLFQLNRDLYKVEKLVITNLDKFFIKMFHLVRKLSSDTKRLEIYQTVYTS